MANQSGSTVSVGCKIPNGLHLDFMEKRVTLNGSNSSSIFGGHGMTHGVDKDFMEGWLKEHKDHPAVKGGFLFVQDNASRAQAKAIEHEEEKTGLEAINPDSKKDPRSAGVKPADED